MIQDRAGNDRVLVFDATNRWISAGIYAEGISIERCIDAGRNAFALLAPTIQEILLESGFTAVDRIVCAVGPGSFTGMRIGVSAARALAQLWKIPVQAVNSLRFYLEDLYRKGHNPAGVLIDAKQKRVYAILSDRAGDPDRQGTAVDLSAEEVLDVEGTYFADDPGALLSYIGSTALRPGVTILQMEPPSPAALYSLAQMSSGSDSRSFRDLTPIYMRSDPATAKYPGGLIRKK